MPIITVELSNFQLDRLQVSLEMIARLSSLTTEAATARFMNSFAEQLSSIKRDPEIGDIGVVGEVLWPDNPVVVQGKW